MNDSQPAKSRSLARGWHRLGLWKGAILAGLLVGLLYLGIYAVLRGTGVFVVVRWTVVDRPEESWLTVEHDAMFGPDGHEDRLSVRLLNGLFMPASRVERRWQNWVDPGPEEDG